MKPITSISVGIALLTLVDLSLLGAVSPVPDKVSCAIADRQDFTLPDRLQLTGWVGGRIAVNAANRLVKIDTARLLEGYRKRPGRQTWDGEHVGKWLHAATLAWVYSGDPALRAKLDETVAELSKCQLEDGYLGTYLDKDRWTHWDVWAHKYNLIGLITYIRYTGNLEPLPTCQRMADLLCRTFGDEPGKRDLIPAGNHVGMAPTSVLEPMVLLYRLTGEPRYLEFCRYILRAWEQPNGPKIISTLLTQKRVDMVANAKAYEMLSCLNGALEYHRTVGDPAMLAACRNAWQDIVEHQLYLTGAASYCELFHGDNDLPNNNNVGETCVTVTWLGEHMNQGKVALSYGPLVLAADEFLLADSGQMLNDLGLPKPQLAALAVTPEAAPANWRTWPGARLFRVNATTCQGDRTFTTRLVPFADAGTTGARYKVWLPVAGASGNVLLDGVESRSRQGDRKGSINDDDLKSYVVTRDGRTAAEDWYAVTLKAPTAIRRVIFVPTRPGQDGGWFVDQPKVEIQRETGGAWESIGTFGAYSAAEVRGSKGRSFTLLLPKPVLASAVRVIGVPASGTKQNQAYSSCAELQAFAE